MAEPDSIGDANGMGVFVEDTVTPVVRQCRSEVKTVQCAEVPGAAGGGFVVYENLAACRAHGCGIEIVGSKEGVPGRRGMFCASWSEEVQSEFSLGNQQVPAIAWKRRWETSQYGEEVVFEGANGPFGCIVSMDMGGVQAGGYIRCQ